LASFGRFDRLDLLSQLNQSSFLSPALLLLQDFVLDPGSLPQEISARLHHGSCNGSDHVPCLKFPWIASHLLPIMQLHQSMPHRFLSSYLLSIDVHNIDDMTIPTS
jgi:hypothetical protein